MNETEELGRRRECTSGQVDRMYKAIVCSCP